MRIIAGQHRGVPLVEVGAGDRAAHLRPTQDRVRESLFNLIAHGTYGEAIRDAHVLDLFAGTGALGFEALSRGAAGVTFVDSGPVALGLIARNAAKLKVEAQVRALARDARRPGPRDGPPAGLVFLDPPYGQGLGEAALRACIEGGWIAPGALLVWEENAGVTPPPGLTLRDARRYGDTMISILTADA